MGQFQHLHPPPPAGSGPCQNPELHSHLWLGGLSLVSVLLLAGTGVLPMFGYEPVPGNA